MRNIVCGMLVVAVALIAYNLCAAPSVSRDLERRGWILYTREGCGYCTDQMKLLGAYSSTVRCGSGSTLLSSQIAPPIACGSATITGYPFWHNTHTGESRVGLQDKSALEQMAR